MIKKIKCQSKINNLVKVRVRIIKPPLVDSIELRDVIQQRARAIVL